MGAAPAINAARPARSNPPEPRLTRPMRIALGFLHLGALFREANNPWRSRAYPQERVLDTTVRALEAMSIAKLYEYEGLHGVRRACVTLTPRGMLVYRDGPHAHRRPPPVQAEGVLREVEQAIGLMDMEAEGLRRQLTMVETSMATARAKITEGERAMASANARLRKLEEGRARLAACRQDLRAFADQACERLGAELAEAGR